MATQDESTQNERFEDTGESIHWFTDETLAVCPQCAGCAVSRRMEKTEHPDWFAPRRVTCRSCSFAKAWAGRQIWRGVRRVQDDYFGLSLWLQTPCCGDLLWAYSEQHLSLLEDFVRARLRERASHERSGWSNTSVISRLPAWIKAAKHRDEVLKGLSRLRVRLAEADR